MNSKITIDRETCVPYPSNENVNHKKCGILLSPQSRSSEGGSSILSSDVRDQTGSSVVGDDDSDGASTVINILSDTVLPVESVTVAVTVYVSGTSKV
jgi:tagatose-1,6-bisphosphate aldolase